MLAPEPSVIDMGQCATEAAARVFGKAWCAEVGASRVIVVYLDVEGRQAAVLAELR